MTFTNAQKTILLILTAVLIVGLLAALTATSIADHETSDVFINRLTQLVGVVTAAVASVAALFRSQQNAKALAAVQEQTNGTTTKLTQINAAQSVALANSTPVTRTQTFTLATPATNTPATFTQDAPAAPAVGGVQPGMSPAEADRAAGGGLA